MPASQHLARSLMACFLVPTSDRNFLEKYIFPHNSFNSSSPDENTAALSGPKSCRVVINCSHRIPGQSEDDGTFCRHNWMYIEISFLKDEIGRKWIPGNLRSEETRLIPCWLHLTDIFLVLAATCPRIDVSKLHEFGRSMDF